MSGRELALQGAKKDGGGRAPIEERDSLRSEQLAQVVDLISEGEVQGLVNGLKSVYLDGVAVENPDGSRNFDDVLFGFLPGTQGQAALPGFDAVQSEVAVGVPVPKATPVVRTITSAAVDAVRVTIIVPQLSRQDTASGDLLGSEFEYAIDVQSAGGGYVERVRETVTGKTMSAYSRGKKIDLRFSGAKPIDVRVRRISDDSASASVVNAFSWQSYTEVQTLRLRYPNSAIAGLQVGARQFQRVPTRAYDMLGIRCRVPANYDPILKSYSGVWNGTFVVRWTDNPAWLFHELVTNTRFGLGEFVTDAQLDKWALYAIGQYCDGMVPDGRGGTEPRFTLNVYIQTREQALRVLQDLAATFRSMVFWAGGMVQLVQDAPRAAEVTYTPAKVVDGRFTYQGSSERQRHSVFVCYYNDPAQFGQRVPEIHAPDDLIARYGIRELELSPIGCTRRGQAARLARWAAYSEEAEGESVTFRVGADGALVLPGAVFKIADPSEAGERLGGLVRSATAAQVTLDAAVMLNAGETYTLTVVLPDPADAAGYVTEERPVTNAAGVQGVLTVLPVFAAAPAAETTWLLQSNLVAATTWRCFGVSEIEEADQFEITAIAHDPTKYALIELGVKTEARPISRLRPNAPRPTGLALTETVYQDGQTFKLRLTVAWLPPQKGLQYVVSWRFERGPWHHLPPTEAQTVDIAGFDKGLVEVGVVSINALGSTSPALEGSINLGGNLAAAANVTGLTLSLAANGVLITCDPSPDFDFAGTEFRAGNLPWEGGTFIARVAATRHSWGWLSAGTHYVMAKHYRRGGPASVGTPVANITFTLPTPLLQVLAGHISEAQLAAALKARVDLVDGAMPGSVNARVADEAAARAAAILAEINARASADTALQTQVSSLAVRSAVFAPLRTWEFAGTAEGWQIYAWGTLTPGVAALSAQASGAGDLGLQIVLPAALQFVGRAADKVRMRVRRGAGGGWNGRLYYATGAHDYSGLHYKDLADPGLTGGEYQVLEWDMAALSAGGTDYVTSTITALRLDLTRGEAGSAGAVFEVDWISFGRRAVGTSEAEIDTIEATIAGNDTAQAARIDRLRAQRAGEVINSDPWATSLENWSNSPFVHSAVAGLSLTAAPIGEATRNALRASQSDVVAYNMPALPFDPARRYRVSCRARRNPGVLSGRLYLAVALWREDMSNISGDGSLWFYPVSFADPGGTPQSGAGEFGAGTAKPFPGDARWMAPGVILAYTGGGGGLFAPGGWMEAWDIRITDVTTASSLQAQITTVSQAQVSGDAALASQVTSIQTGLQQASGNRVRNSAFAADSNGDGLADGWVPYNNAGIAYAHALLPSPLGGVAQYIDFYGTPTTNTLGIACDAGNHDAWEPGATYVLAMYLSAAGGHVGQVAELGWNVPPASVLPLLNPPLGDAFARYAFRITWGASVEPAGRFYLTSSANAGPRNGVMRFAKASVHKGTEVTPWDGGADVQTFASRYALEVDANGRVAGISLAARADAGGVGSSSIKLRADRLSIGNPNAAGGDQDLFVVYTSDTTVDGVFIPAGVYVRDLFVATLSGLKIKAQSIETEQLKVGSVSANVAISQGGSGVVMPTGSAYIADFSLGLSVAKGAGFLRLDASLTVLFTLPSSVAAIRVRVLPYATGPADPVVGQNMFDDRRTLPPNAGVVRASMSFPLQITVPGAASAGSWAFRATLNVVFVDSSGGALSISGGTVTVSFDASATEIKV